MFAFFHQKSPQSVPWALAALVLFFLLTGCQTPRKSERSYQKTESITMAERRLLNIHERQERLMQSYRENPGEIDRDSMEMRVINLIRLYESHLRSNPDDLTARILYGKFLVAVGQSESAIRQFLEVDRRDPTLPVVKQQIGNYLAESGRYMAALPYFINATDLDKDEGLYPYQLGLLLHQYASQFIHDGFYDRSTLDMEMQQAFREACRRDPENFAFQMRYGESYSDVAHPDWEAALQQWEKTLPIAANSLDRQIIHLHQARALFELKRDREAMALVERVTLEELAYSRDRLMESYHE